MTEQVNAYRQLFQDSLEMALQAGMMPKLVQHAEPGNHAGGEKTRLILRAGSKNTRTRTTRYAPLTHGDISLNQRWVDAYNWDIEPDLVDSLDKVRMARTHHHSAAR